MAYAPFEFYQWLAATICAATALVIASGVIVWSLRKVKEKENYFGVALMAAFFSVLPGLILFIDGIGGISNALSAKYAPQAWAAKYIIKKLER